MSAALKPAGLPDVVVSPVSMPSSYGMARLNETIAAALLSVDVYVNNHYLTAHSF
jgi:hypothetical protein